MLSDWISQKHPRMAGHLADDHCRRDYALGVQLLRLTVAVNTLLASAFPGLLVHFPRPITLADPAAFWLESRLTEGYDYAVQDEMECRSESAKLARLGALKHSFE